MSVTMSARVVAIVLLLVAQAEGRQAGIRGAVQQPHPHSEVPPLAPAAAPEGPAIETAQVQWEMENLNYLDMTEELGDFQEEMMGEGLNAEQKLEKVHAKEKHKKKDHGEQSGIDGFANSIDEGVGDMFGTKLMQVHSKTDTVQKAMRQAVEASVKALLSDGCGASPSASPAVAPAPAAPPAMAVPPPGMLPPPVALVSGAKSSLRAKLPAATFVLHVAAPSPAGAAPGPAPGPAMPCPQPQVHVSFAPGKKRVLNGPAEHPVIVKVTIFDRPGNKLDDMAGVKTELKQAVSSGELKEKMVKAVHEATGVKPQLAALKVKTKIVKQWEFQKCGVHITKLVKKLSVAYSRRQVPLALYNECTVFRTKMSFSHDYILDPRDRSRCRKATRKFAQSWKLDKAKEDPKEFEPLCQRFCEAKFGDNAPQCVY